MDKAVEALTRAFGKLSDSLDNTNLPVWAKIVGLALVAGLTVLFVAQIISLCLEFYRNGVANYAAGKLVIETFFNAAVLSAIYAALKLLIDKSGSGVADVLEDKEKDGK